MIRSKGDRAILWGTRITSGEVYAELAFFNKNIYNPTVELISDNHNTSFEPIKVEIPEMFLKNPFPGRSQHIRLKIIS